MTQQLVQGTPAGPLAAFADRLPPMIAGADDRTAWRFVDFFAVTIRNPNTREAYYRAVSRFMDWCEQHGLHRLAAIRPIHVAAYVEQLPLSRPSVRQHLSAISRCFDWMVSGGTLDTNPATSVQRPRHVVRTGRTPVLSDRAIIATMLYTFGRVGAVIAMDVEDYRLSNHQRTFLLHEKGGKEHHVPAHHRLVEYLGEYMDATGLWHSPKSPLFQAVDITKSRAQGHPDEQADRVPDGEATRQTGRAASHHQLPQLPRHRHHQLPLQRRFARGRTRHRRSRVVPDHAALRPHRRQHHTGRGREDQVLRSVARPTCLTEQQGCSTTVQKRHGLPGLVQGLPIHYGQAGL